MKLYEFEGHNILKKVGIASPFFVVCASLDEIKQARKRLKFPIVAKVQVLAGKRGKGGGVKICTNEKQLVDFAEKFFGSDFSGEKVRFITLAEKVEIEKEHYVSITYDTLKKIPFIIYSSEGGMDIEEVKDKNPEKILRVDIDPLGEPSKKEVAKVLGRDFNDEIYDFILRLWDAFKRYDLRLVEVNPLAQVVGSHPRGVQSRKGVQSRNKAQPGGDHSYVAIDAKVILDDAGLSKHKDLDVLPKGAVSAVPTDRELSAKKIDAEDYRGSAGSKFIEFEGDIAVLASGGGASLLVMDSLIDSGGVPANYTEYSGNPPCEKVEKLTKITLSREGLAGCLVAGAVANFTDIYETLSGFVRGLSQIKPKPDYPIVIRRGGPRQKEAYEMLAKVAKKEGYDIHLFGGETPISIACKKMVELSKQYKATNPV